MRTLFFLAALSLSAMADVKTLKGTDGSLYEVAKFSGEEERQEIELLIPFGAIHIPGWFKFACRSERDYCFATIQHPTGAPSGSSYFNSVGLESVRMKDGRSKLRMKAGGSIEQRHDDINRPTVEKLLELSENEPLVFTDMTITCKKNRSSIICEVVIDSRKNIFP